MTEWIEIRTLCGDSHFVRGACLHDDRVPVEAAITGEIVAQLCTSCDAQLPADWAPSYAAPTVTELNAARPITPDFDIIEETYR